MQATASEDGCRDAALLSLRERFPDTTFLALGQTVLWDEPTKAALRLRLDSQWPSAHLLAGVHDTDYFAKLHSFRTKSGATFALVSHDDHKTRTLWSAAGEMSKLFGSEDVPTRALLQSAAGVSLKRALAFAEDPDELLSELTTAWGWTGILHAGWERQVAAEVSLAEILPTLLEQISWATENSPVGTTLAQWITEFAQANPEATLPDLYVSLLPQLYSLLLGAPARNLSTTRTTELLRFNLQTYHLPRFWLVEAFLAPATRQSARDAYDLAVGGGEQYTLDVFGPGARPFDVVVPGRGRGTLRVRNDGSVWIDTPEPIHLPGSSVVTSARQLAERLEAALGPECVLIGKAVALLPMLAAEWVLVFHEGASSYSGRTAKMIAELKHSRTPIPALRPILRVRYHTWDSLDALVGVTLPLPAHLKQALGKQEIEADDFATCWQRARVWEKNRLAELTTLRSPHALMAWLTRHDRRWSEKIDTYDAAQATLLTQWNQAKALRDQERALRAQAHQLRAKANVLEHAKGDDFRQRGRVLGPEAVSEREARFEVPLRRNRRQIHDLLLQARQLRQERKTLERSPQIIAARTTLRLIEAEAEIARVRQAKNALQTIHGLLHTDYRPSAWWFPQVDPSGAWFRRVAETAELHLEELVA